MILVVGLGNPGKKFEKTPHNLGRRVVTSWQQVVRFSDFKFEKKFNALISKGVFNKKKIILALPETFMNLSGKSVKLLTTFYKILTTNLWLVHDDIDLSLGKIRIVKNRGAAGHKGVQSIIDALKTKDFVRFRIGIKPNSKFKMQNAKLQFKIQNFVLKNFSKNEEKIVKEVIKKTIEAIECSLKFGLEKTMQEYNK